MIPIQAVASLSPPRHPAAGRACRLVGSWDSWETKSQLVGSRHEMTPGLLTPIQLRRAYSHADFGGASPSSASTGQHPGERVALGLAATWRDASNEPSPTLCPTSGEPGARSRKQAPSHEVA